MEWSQLIRLQNEGSGLDQHDKPVPYEDEKSIIMPLSARENGAKSILTSTQQLPLLGQSRSSHSNETESSIQQDECS